MLEFVHTSGGAGGKDEKNRKKVRSQAMRDFRRRQREEKEAGKSDKKQLSMPRDRRGMSPTASSNLSGARVGSLASTASHSTQISSRRESLREYSPRLSPFISQEEGENVLQAMESPQTMRQHSVQPDFESLASYGNWDFELFQPADEIEDLLVEWPADAPLQRLSSTISQHVEIQTGDTADPFESPKQIEQMLGFCRSYLHWLCPGVDTETAGSILGQIWDKSTSVGTLIACCLASAGHLDAVQPDRPRGNYQLYKARALQDIRKRMEDRETATSDETIGILTCLLSFEMSNCNEESITHLRGLRNLLSQREEIPPMVLTLDLLHAILFDNSRIVTNDSSQHSSAAMDLDEARSNPEIISRLDAILVAEVEQFQQNSRAPHTEGTHGLIALLGDTATGMRHILLNNSTYHSISTLPPNLHAFGNQTAHDPNAVHLRRCCYNTMLILYNVLVHKTPHRHRHNQRHVHSTLDAFKRLPVGVWEELAYLRLYVLLTAAATAQDHAAKSFVKAELLRSIYLMGEAEWRRIEAFLQRFLQRSRILDRLAGTTPSG